VGGHGRSLSCVAPRPWVAVARLPTSLRRGLALCMRSCLWRWSSKNESCRGDRPTAGSTSSCAARCSLAQCAPDGQARDAIRVGGRRQVGDCRHASGILFATVWSRSVCIGLRDQLAMPMVSHFLLQIANVCPHALLAACLHARLPSARFRMLATLASLLRPASGSRHGGISGQHPGLAPGRFCSRACRVPADGVPSRLTASFSSCAALGRLCTAWRGIALYPIGASSRCWVDRT